MKLRTAVLTACLIALAASPAFAQGSRGVKVGLNLSNVTIDPEEEGFGFERLTGFLAGFYFRAGGNDVISLQPEVLFSMQGAKGHDEAESFKLKLNYIQIPVLAHVNVGTAAVQPYVTVGPTFGVRIKAELEDENSNETLDFKDDIKLIDVGLAVGVGVQMKRGVSIEARYTFGLTDIAVTDGPNIGGDDISLKNKVLSINLGFGF